MKLTASGFAALVSLVFGLSVLGLVYAEPRPARLTVTVTAEEFKALRREVTELRAELKQLRGTIPEWVTRTPGTMPPGWQPNNIIGSQGLWKPESLYSTLESDGRFPAPDGCNTCYQDERGNTTACTLLSCIDWPAKRWNIFQENTR